jgi:spore germination protein
MFTYGCDESWTLLAPEIDDTPSVDAAIAAGSAPVLLLSTLGPDGSFDNRLSNALFTSPKATDRLISSLISTMKEKGYRGIDVDFEYVLPEDSKRYAAFIRLLRERMNAEGFAVMVALAPKTSDDQQGLLYEGHDYAALGEAADAVLLMTYEWGYAFGAPGPIAPIDKVEQVIDYALMRIPPEKIFLGIPNYGYDWPLPFTAGGTERAKTLTQKEALEIAERYGAEILFDERSASPYFYYTAEDSRRHVVHFEDVRSYNRKLSLLAEKGLAGASVWTVMNDNPSLLLLLNALFDIL